MKSRALISKGFTLIEVMIALAILSIVVTAVYTTFISQNNNALIQEDVADVQQNARIALDMMARDIRGSGVGLSSPSFSVTTANGTSVITSANSLTLRNSISTVATAISPNGTNWDVTVYTTLGFSAGDYVRVISSINQSLDRNGGSLYVVDTPAPTATKLTIGSISGGSSVSPVAGDLIIKCQSKTTCAAGDGTVSTISYVYTLNGTQLQRITYNGNGVATTSVIADDIQSLNVDATTQYPLNNISLTVQSSKPVSNINGVVRTRTLTAHFMKKN